MATPGSFEKAFGGPAAVAAQAPGRVNLIGEHTDYNEGFVLPAAISLHTRVWLRYRRDDRVCGFSRELGPAEALLDAPPAGHWLDYPRGAARILREARRVAARGFEIYVESDLPEGSGLSSSAALDVATALCLASAAGAPFRRDERPLLAELCQKVEVEFIGMPCGIMDPYAIACCGEEGALLLSCRDLSARPIAVPEGLELVIFDTRVRRALRDGGYQTRRKECDEALEGVRHALGVDLRSLSELEPVALDGLRGALADVPFRRARHVITENARVLRFAEALERDEAGTAGEQMYASHLSLQRDYEVTWPEADFLVDRAAELEGVHGARMTGAGWGGCTVQLIEAEAAHHCIASLTASFREEFGGDLGVWRTRASAGADLLRD
jgi:galactokinase